MVEVTYIGDYSGLSVSEINQKVTRGEAFRAPKEWIAKQIALRPTQWQCDSAEVAELAKPLIEAEAKKQAEYDAAVAEAAKPRELPAHLMPKSEEK
jgi:hypothetical protein